MRTWTIDLSRSRVCLEEAVRLAQAGYAVEITEEGHPVARLVLTRSGGPVRTPGLARKHVVRLPDDTTPTIPPTPPPDDTS